MEGSQLSRMPAEGGAPRAHRDPEFLARMTARVFEPHVAPLNHLVQEMRHADHPAPWVDPAGGGVQARILFLHESPGPMASSAHGSGIVSPDNDDPTAARFFRLARQVGLPRSAFLNWNAVPWYISDTRRNQNATLADFREAEPWLHRFIGLLAHLSVVVTMGNFAGVCWLRYLRRPDSPVLPLIVSPHPADRARVSRPQFEEEIATAMRKALHTAPDSAV